MGVVTSPIKVFKSAKTAPLSRHHSNRVYNTIADTGLATLGYSDTSDPLDIPIKGVSFAIGNATGGFLGNKMLGRGEHKAARAGLNILGNAISDFVNRKLNK